MNVRRHKSSVVVALLAVLAPFVTYFELSVITEHGLLALGVR